MRLLDSVDWVSNQIRIKRGITINESELIVDKYVYVQWEINEKRRYMGRVLKTEQNLDLNKHRELAGSVSASQSVISGTGN